MSERYLLNKNILMKSISIKIVCPPKILDKLIINKRQRIPKMQSKMDNPEKLATQGTKTKKDNM